MLLCVVMLCGTLAACNGVGGEAETTTASQGGEDVTTTTPQGPVTTTVEPNGTTDDQTTTLQQGVVTVYPKHTAYSFCDSLGNPRAYIMLVRKSRYAYLYGTEASTSDVSIAAYKRNTLLNTMYGINIITIVADESRNITAVDKTSEIVNSTGVLMSDKTARGSDVTPFTNGTSLTMAQCLYVANQVRVKIGTAFEYGILVMPKLYEADEYASYCYGLSSFAVPDAAKDIHLSAVVLDCMNWLSSNVSEEDGGMGDNCLTSVYYKGVVQGQLVDSPEDVDMLQLTRDTVYFDFGYIVNFKVKIEDSFRSAAIAGESVGAKMTAIVTYAESGVTDMMEFYNR